MVGGSNVGILFLLSKVTSVFILISGTSMRKQSLYQCWESPELLEPEERRKIEMSKSRKVV